MLFEDALPLGGAPAETVTADVVPVTRAAAAKGIVGLFDADGVSTIAGRAALLPRGALSEEAVEEATTAGAVAVLVDGPLPAGAFSLDVPAGVPVVGLPQRLVKEIRSLVAAGVPVTVAIGSVDVAENVEERVDRGLLVARARAGGGLKPDLVAAGVAVPTSEPGRGDEGEVRFGTVSGTSAAAAVAAGAAAVLAQGRPRVGAAALAGSSSAPRSAPTSTSPPPGPGSSTSRAVQQEVAAVPASISFGSVEARPSSTASGSSGRSASATSRRARLVVRIGSAALAPKGV